MVPIDLHNRPIAITGASSGIGAATARACAREGMPVVLMARRREALDAVASAIRADGGQAEVVVGDVTDPDAGRRLTEHAAGAFGSIYAVFANAGYGYEGPVLADGDERVRAIFETNFWGTLNTVRPAVERMRTAGTGHVIVCSSCLSKIGIPFVGPYCATKAAQDHLGRAMRHELRTEGVHVSTVHPIGTKTEFFDTAASNSDASDSLLFKTPPALMQPAERVANAIVRCLRKPKGEVWTSRSTRLLLALSVALPGMTDWALARKLAKIRRETA